MRVGALTWPWCDPTSSANSISTSAQVGNGIIAIVAGVVAEYAASEYGYQAPFVVAIIPLSILAVTVSSTWSENYGDQTIAASAG